MKKLFLIVVLLLVPIIGVDASSISSIDMDIYVDDYGNATITESWDAYVNQGTEGWHPYYNLGNSKISNVNVLMDGKEFTTISDWNENSSLSDKAYKAGLYYPGDDEVDVVFGITSYGNHKYVIQYRISNFVSTLEDADMIYWNLFPSNFSAEPDSVSIQIYSDFRYEDTLDVWGYGDYGAPCYVYDGRIEMSSNGKLSSDEYLTILVKFPKGTFQTSNVLDNNFDYYYQMALAGAVSYQSNTKQNGSKWVAFLGAFLAVFINVLVWGFFIVILIFTTNKSKKVSFGSIGNKVKKDIPNFRDIPCNKDIYRAYWVAYNYNLIKKKENFLGTILLKWLNNGNVRVEKVIEKGLFKKGEVANIVFINSPNEGIELETKLYNWMYEASLDGKLESNEFKKWCSKHYSKIFKWFDDILEYENQMLVNDGKATIKTVTTLKFFKYDVYEIDASVMQDAEQLAGLKKFLKEFTLIKEKEPIEVQLWNEYLMYAQIFGMADKVASQFKKLYPEVIVDMDSMGYTYDDILFIHMISYDGMKSASSAKTRAESYSSGGGGFSSGGGGGGSFGGGSGGGGFR